MQLNSLALVFCQFDSLCEWIYHVKILIIKIWKLEFPGGPVVKNHLPVEGAGYPCSRKIPHAVGQLNPYTATIEAHTP